MNNTHCSSVFAIEFEHLRAHGWHLIIQFASDVEESL